MVIKEKLSEAVEGVKTTVENMETNDKLALALKGAGAVANVCGACGVPFVGMVGTALNMGGKMLASEEVPEVPEYVE